MEDVKITQELVSLSDDDLEQIASDQDQIRSAIATGKVTAVYRCKCGNRWRCGWDVGFLSDHCRDRCDKCKDCITPWFPPARIISGLINIVPQVEI